MSKFELHKDTVKKGGSTWLRLQMSTSIAQVGSKAEYSSC